MRLALTICFAILAVVSLNAAPVSAQETPAALNFKMKSIHGEEISLSKYVGKVVVFVNVASKCGYTPQYQQLQELHAKYADQGLAIIGIPCNQFLGQEPGTEEEILAFCQENYGVEFDLMSKVNVKGKEQIELYRYLTALDLAPNGRGPVKWNFEKIVLDKTGKPVARFSSKVSPASDEFIAVIQKALADPAFNKTGTGVKPYRHESKKLGKSYYLFSKQVPLKNSGQSSTIYFFAKEPTNDKGTPVAEVPEDKVVTETKTGMLVLKNKDGKQP